MTDKNEYQDSTKSIECISFRLENNDGSFKLAILYFLNLIKCRNVGGKLQFLQVSSRWEGTSNPNSGAFHTSNEYR